MHGARFRDEKLCSCAGWRFNCSGAEITAITVCIIKKKSHGVKQKCKNMPLVQQNVMKFEVFILGGQINDQKRNKGWWRGSRERIEMEAG